MLAAKITSELHALLGEPLAECGRVANMQMFGFGPPTRSVTLLGKVVEHSKYSLHLQCRWRFTNEHEILFGSDDLNYPADENTSLEGFDWDQSPSLLDVKQQEWFTQHGGSMQVTEVIGDRYGGFRVLLEQGIVLEAFPCDSRRDDYSEHWRFFGHRADESHFVVSRESIRS